ncbi:indole-3-acetate O-methyltransferase [Salvia divinorum]
MNAGDGPLSYLQNSSYQGGTLDVARLAIEEEIETKLEFSSEQTSICIADFGCSTGNNSFPAMHTIIEAIKRKHEFSYLKTLEFYVFFNDVAANDFNTLFRSLPPSRSYGVAAVPGDFHRRLLPPSSLHFAYASWSLHWLTEAPEAAADSGTPAWNGGEIVYTRERKEVCDAYLDQFGKDVVSFLKSRVVEMVDGGLIALLLPGAPAAWDPEKEYTMVSLVEPLRSSLVDMAMQGRVSEAKIDSFNIPYYFPTLRQLMEIIERNPSFTVEKIETINATGNYTFPSIHARIAFFRAAHEGMLAHHFGGEIIDDLFDQYEKKLGASPILKNVENDKTLVILAILKKNIRP